MFISELLDTAHLFICTHFIHNILKSEFILILLF